MLLKSTQTKIKDVILVCVLIFIPNKVGPARTDHLNFGPFHVPVDVKTDLLLNLRIKLITIGFKFPKSINLI